MFERWIDNRKEYESTETKVVDRMKQRARDVMIRKLTGDVETFKRQTQDGSILTKNMEGQMWDQYMTIRGTELKRERGMKYVRTSRKKRYKLL